MAMLVVFAKTYRKEQKERLRTIKDLSTFMLFKKMTSEKTDVSLN